MLPVIIYCCKINFIVTSKSRTLKKPLIVMDQLWHLVRQWVISCLGEQAVACYHTKSAKFWHYPQQSTISSLCILPCIMPQVLTNLGPVTWLQHIQLWQDMPPHAHTSVREAKSLSRYFYQLDSNTNIPSNCHKQESYCLIASCNQSY